MSSPSRRPAPRWLAVGGCGHWRRPHPGRPASSVLYNLPTHREIQSRPLNCKPAQGGRQLRIHAAKPTQKINREGTQNELDVAAVRWFGCGRRTCCRPSKQVPSADRRLDPVVGRLASVAVYSQPNALGGCSQRRNSTTGIQRHRFALWRAHRRAWTARRGGSGHCNSNNSICTRLLRGSCPAQPPPLLGASLFAVHVGGVWPRRRRVGWAR